MLQSTGSQRVRRDLGTEQQWYRTCLPTQDTRVRSLGQEDPLEEDMATPSRILAWRIPQTEEPGGPQSMQSQRVSHDRAGAHS